ncbi:hypothetical protein GCM10010377_48280 [Streptomyces viridiviolaceus]|nr:hypothetical protein GCM10010377_48280 [Streptomyces viridiviolaceus]
MGRGRVPGQRLSAGRLQGGVEEAPVGRVTVPGVALPSMRSGTSGYQDHVGGRQLRLEPGPGRAGYLAPLQVN